MKMLKNILDSEGILVGWKPSSNTYKYDKYHQVRTVAIPSTCCNISNIHLLE